MCFGNITSNLPEQMREEIAQLGREHAMVRACIIAADIGGFSAEDKYTLIAYHALRALMECQAMRLDMALRDVPPVILTGDCSAPH